MSNPSSSRALVLLAVLGTACGSATGPDSDGPDPGVAANLLAVASSAGPSGTTACPEGGEIQRQTTSSVQWNGDVVTNDYHITLEFLGCAYQMADQSITIDGESALDGHVRNRVPEGGPSTLLELTSHQTGNLRWRGPGYDTVCEVDLTTTFEPDTDMIHVVGHHCDHAVDFRFPIPPPPQGT